jgi:chemotaxis protein methyltransferase CheR
MALTPELRAEFLDLVDRRFGIRESEYGITRIDDAVAQVLPTTRCADARELLDRLIDDEQPGWLDSLVEHLTVGETYFFRDSAQVAALRELVLPSVIKRRIADRRLRIWSAGCSTGEEPYTFALLLQEFPILVNWQVLLVGTDVNRDSLRRAREARYPQWSFRATPDDVRQRFFEHSGNRWRLSDAVRQKVRFGWLNLGANPLMPPSADFDVIACRNVTIYFDEAATQRLYTALINALAPGGWLLLGPSDPLPVERDQLERVELPSAVLWRRRDPMARPVAPVVRQAAPATRAPKRKPLQPVVKQEKVTVGDAQVELEAGLLALEAGSTATALEWLRRATFRDPNSPLSQFALARAYLGVGDVLRAHAALIHARRLLGCNAARNSWRSNRPLIPPKTASKSWCAAWVPSATRSRRACCAPCKA